MDIQIRVQEREILSEVGFQWEIVTGNSDIEAFVLVHDEEPALQELKGFSWRECWTIEQRELAELIHGSEDRKSEGCAEDYGC